VDAPHDLGRGHHVVHPPAVGAAHVHELDEAQDVAAAAEVAGHGDDLVVVEAALDDHVDLERARPAASAAAMPASTSETGTSMSFMARKVASSRESRLTVTRASPAALRAAAFWAAARRWW
jgi:hypothetical protein